MKIAHIRWVLIGLLVFWLVLNLAFSTERRTLGISAEWNNGEYHFSAGTEPAALLFAVLLVGAYILLIHAEETKVGKPVRGVFRRFMAFWLDLLVAITAMAPILGVMPTIVEWRRTGEFQWTFERTTMARGDAVQMPLLLLVMVVALLFYHAVPLVRNRPSPGACIMGYTVGPDDGTVLTLKQAILRTMLGFVAASAWYITPFIGRDRQHGKVWLDKTFSTRAILLG